MFNSKNIGQILLLLVGFFVLYSIINPNPMKGNQQIGGNPPCDTYPLFNCWDRNYRNLNLSSRPLNLSSRPGSISGLAKEILPNSTPTIQITPRVPLVLPKSEVPLYVKKKEGEIECTSDLECNFPRKCCDGKCKDRIMIEQVRNGSLYSPQRIGICPPSKFRHPCTKTSDCESNYLCCQGVDWNSYRCRDEPTYFYGGFKGHYLDSNCKRIRDRNFCHKVVY